MRAIIRRTGLLDDSEAVSLCIPVREPAFPTDLKPGDDGFVAQRLRGGVTARWEPRSGWELDHEYADREGRHHKDLIEKFLPPEEIIYQVGLAEIRFSIRRVKSRSSLEAVLHAEHLQSEYCSGNGCRTVYKSYYAVDENGEKHNAAEQPIQTWWREILNGAGVAAFSFRWGLTRESKIRYHGTESKVK